MLVKEPLCIRGAFNCPLGPLRSRRVGELMMVRSVPPAIVVMTPLFPLDELENVGSVWQKRQFAPPLEFELVKISRPRFSLSVKFANDDWPAAPSARPSSNFESKDWILRINWASALWIRVSSIPGEPKAALKRIWYSGSGDIFASKSEKFGSPLVALNPISIAFRKGWLVGFSKVGARRSQKTRGS